MQRTRVYNIMRYLKDLQFQHLLCLLKTELTGCINVHYLSVSIYSGIFKTKVIELTVLKSILSTFTHTQIRGSGWGGTDVSCHLKFWPFVSCQLNFGPFLSFCQ